MRQHDNLSDESRQSVSVSLPQPTGENCETKQKGKGLFDHFFSLVSQVKIDGEKELLREESHQSHLPPKEKEPLIKSPSIRGLPHIFRWLSIAFEEGHLEPFQPEVGRLVGWPIRRKKLHHLSAEFVLWSQRNNIHFDLPTKEEFLLVLDQIFIRKGDEYEFPALDICRQKFAQLRTEYGHS